MHDSNKKAAGRLTEIYSDINYKLKKDSAGNITKVKNADSISQSVKTILSTYPGERIMLPEFGSRLREYIFSPMDIGTADLLSAEIEDALEKWEPRITVIEVYIEENVDANQYIINIEYAIIDTGKTETFSGKINKL